MTHKGIITLETERLVLRPYTAGDFEIADSWRNNPTNSRYLNFEPGNEEQTLSWRNRVTERSKAEPRLSYDFAVELRETESVIGTCGIYCGSNFDTAGVAWLLHIEHWNKGYGTELCGELLRFGFADLQLRRITANCAAVNHGSYRVMEHNGMRREATKKKAFWAQVDKEWIDEAEYAILAEDYFNPAPTPHENWGQGVGGVVIYNGKVLLARRIGGKSDGKLIIPGGYVNYGETPQDALKREFLEETGVEIEPRDIVGIRFNMHDWYVIFRVAYISGEAYAADSENSEVLWVDVAEIANNAEITGITRLAIERAISGVPTFQCSAEYDTVGSGNPPFSLYL